jgi:hypothetical protein
MNSWERVGGDVQLNAWNYVVLTYDGTTRRHYINGVEVGRWDENVPLSSPPPGQGNVNIGRWPNGAAEYFPGRIEDVAVYDTALSADQVSQHFVLGGGQPPPETPEAPASALLLGLGALVGTVEILWVRRRPRSALR